MKEQSARPKKLKKLARIAYLLIKQWGWKYFFYISKEEWKKQKWGIFLPDAKPIGLFDRISFQEQYEDYLSFIEKKFLNDSSNSYVPQITFLVYYESANFKNVQRILNSFLEQSYDNWNLVLIPKTNDVVDSSLLPQDERISVLFNSENKLILDKINSLKYDFLGILDSNVLLPSYSLEQFAKFLKKNPDSDIFYSDNDDIDEHGKRHNPFFKPDWSLITFRSFDYVSSLCIMKKTLVEKVFTNEIPTDFYFDLLVHCIEKSEKIYHIPLPLYSILDSQTIFSTEYRKNILIKMLQL